MMLRWVPVRVRTVVVQCLVLVVSAAIASGAVTNTYQPDIETQVEDLGEFVVVDQSGASHTVHRQAVTSVMCGGVVADANGVQRIVGHPETPLPSDFFSEEPDDPNAVVLTFSDTGGGNAKSAAANLAFVVSVSGTLPTGAEAAMSRVFHRYIALLDDDVTVRLKLFFKALGDTSVIGSTRSYVDKYSYSTARASLIIDADPDDTLQAALPASPISVNYGGSSPSSETKIKFRHAAAKAAGLRSAHHSSSDGRLKFNTLFPFDFDSSDGIDAGTMDFEFVLQHEVGHLLGFVSGVDDDKNDIEALDAARFTTGQCATSAANFGTRIRIAGKKTQGTTALTCLPGFMTSSRMSTGRNGDGEQASHWRDSPPAPTWIGMMDPTLQFRENKSGSGLAFAQYMTNADLQSLDFIGWDYQPINTNLGSVSLVAPPADYATFVSLTPTLSWTAATNAFDYQLVVIKRVTAGGTPTNETVIDASVAGLSYSVPSGILAPNTTYSWSVTARNPYNSQQSQVWEFTTSYQGLLGPALPFGLLYPASGAVGQSRTLGLGWADVVAPDSEIVSYTLLIDDEIHYEPPHTLRVIGLPPNPGPNYPVPPRILRNNQTYHWRVIAMNGAGSVISDPVSGGTFTTGVWPPEEFGLLTPFILNPEASPTPVFSWQPAWEADAYTLEVDDDQDFSSPVISQQTQATSYETPAGLLQSSTNYWWRVLASNSSGTTPWAPAWSCFTTLPPQPGAFGVTSPANGTAQINNTPTLEWTSSADATAYLVEISTDPLLEDGVVTLTSSSESLSVPSGLLDPGVVYYWRVTSLNSSGFQRSSTDDFTFLAGDAPVAVPGLAVGSLPSFLLGAGIVIGALRRIRQQSRARCHNGASGG